MQEIWKDIKGYEGLYEISNFGNIKSTRHGKVKMLKTSTDKYGYKRINLYKNGVVKIGYIHKLVINTFIENTNNLPCINHINGIKSDNNLTNLEYCTYSHNIKEAFRLGLKKPSITTLNKRGKLSKNSKVVYQFDLDGKFIKKWYGTREIERELKLNHSYISKCCRKKVSQVGGYIWRYEEEIKGVK